MPTQIEDELKWILDQAGLTRLESWMRTQYGDPDLKQQRNRFIDTPEWALRRQGIALRLRRENERLMMTVKSRTADHQPDHGSGRFVHREDEEELDPELFTRLDQLDLQQQLPLPQHLLQALDSRPLEVKGGFDNRRLSWDLEDQREEVSLDRTDFRQRWDHELEVETQDAKRSQTFWSALMEELDIDCQPQTVSKLARYLLLNHPDVADTVPESS